MQHKKHRPARSRIQAVLFSVHPEIPDVTLVVSEPKAGIFSSGKKIKELRGVVLLYAAQARPKIDAARAEKHPFRTETI